MTAAAAVATALYIEYSEGEGEGEGEDKMLQAVADYIKEKPDALRWSFGGSYEGRIDVGHRQTENRRSVTAMTTPTTSARAAIPNGFMSPRTNASPANST